MIIKVTNSLPQNSGKTYLADLTSSGAGTLSVRNGNSFQPSWGIQIGEVGQEQSEVTILGTASVSGTSLTLLGTTQFDHPEDTPVYSIKYDQVVFMRSTSGTAGTATPITNGTVTIQADNLYTQFDDTSGAISYAYKTKFYNSVLNVYSSESDWITTEGYSFYSLAKLRQRAKGKLYNASYVTDPDDWNDWANEWYEQMLNAMVDVNSDYLLGTVDIAFSGTAELGTITDPAFKYIRRIWMTQDGNSFYRATRTDINAYVPDQTFNITNPYYSEFGNNVIMRRPNDTQGTARVVYYKMLPFMSDDTDELPPVMKDYTKSFVDYMVAQAKAKDGKDVEATNLENKAQGAKERFKMELTPRNRAGFDTVTILEESGEMSEAW